MHYGNIKKFDIANGQGVRISLFVSGCRNHCFNCFQPETWAFDYGQEYTKETQQDILDFLGQDMIQGLTILGGDPFEPENQPEVATLCKKVRETYPQKNIWIYTGYILDQDLLLGGTLHSQYTDIILDNIDVLVDGPFIDAQKNISLAFRGSENQRVIDVQKSLENQEIVLYLE